MRGATQHFKPGQVRGHSQTLLLYQPLCPSLWALPSSDAKKHTRAPVNRQLVQGQPPTFPHPTPDLLLLLHVGLSHLSALCQVRLPPIPQSWRGSTSIWTNLAKDSLVSFSAFLSLRSLFSKHNTHVMIVLKTQ